MSLGRQQKREFVLDNKKKKFNYALWLQSMSELSAQTTTLITRSLMLLVIANLVMNYLWRQQLYNLGLQTIITMQRSQNILFTSLFRILTLLLDPTLIIVLCFTMIILTKQKSKAIYITVWILLNAFMSCLLKAFYADPRPFWSKQEINSLGFSCPQQYANPSGHSWFSPIIGFGILLHQYGPGNNSTNLFISLALIILVPMSRMYLGAHSLNQVIQGVFFGLVMVIFYQFCALKQIIKQYLSNFHSTPGHKWKKFTLLLHLSYLTGFLFNVKDYNSYFQPIPDNWAANIIDQCRESIPSSHLNFTMLMLNSLIANFATGLAWGFGDVANTTKGRIYLSGKWLINEQRYTLWVGYVWFFIIESGLLLIGLAPGTFAMYLIGPSYLVIFLFGNIWTFLAGFLYTSQAFKLLFAREVIREEIN